jgi:hypothetical protein
LTPASYFPSLINRRLVVLLRVGSLFVVCCLLFAGPLLDILHLSVCWLLAVVYSLSVVGYGLMSVVKG